MATKKAAPKKPTSTATKKSSPAAAKKSTAKAAPKKTAAKRKVAKKKVDLRSFHMCQDPEPFLNVRFSRQTIYWLVIAVLAIGFSAWVLSVQADINDLFDQIEALQSQA